MAKKKSAAPAAGKLAGKTVAFAGKFGSGNHDLDAMRALVAAEGGVVAEPGRTALDYLVAGTGVVGNPPTAVAKIQEKYPQVQLLDQTSFYQLVNPTAGELLDILRSGPHGYEYWSAMQERLYKGGAVLDLSGTDFRNRTIEGTLYKVCLDGCDFRGAKLTAHFDKIKGAKFDGATFDGGSLTNAEDCSLKNVTMNDTRWNPADFTRCDFSGARLVIPTGDYTTATDCIFNKADLSGACLGESRFPDADFRGATLTGAQLQKCDFTGANLSGADLSSADLREARFTNADLRKGKFKDAILSEADLTGAIIDGADFTGANVAGANLTGLDLSKAKQLVPKAARTAGPYMRELAKVANGSKRLRTAIELELGKEEYVILEPSLNRYGSYVYAGAGYHHSWPGNTLSSGTSAPTFEQGMLNLTDLWSRGSPRFDTVKVEAKKCPLRGKALLDLAVAAWYEAFGLKVPTAAELQMAAEQRASANASLREALIAELSGGTAGVMRWNKRSQRDRGKLGKLRKQDFTNAELAGVYLDRQDLEGCKFDGANLKQAVFCGSQLKGASFTNADCSGANLASCKSSDASFAGATLAQCNLRAANFRRCIFQNTDLTNSDFAFSDLCGADFRHANLAGVKFMRTKFDESTLFPPDFVSPEGLEWKGAGPTAPPSNS